jgi:hypothetical protein
MLTLDRAKEVLDYDPGLGIFRWKIDRPTVNKRAGDIAGSINKVSGYVVITIDGGQYYGHVLAWFFIHGEWPPSQVDHRDLNRSNNAEDNLRLATMSQQRANQLVRRDSKTGVKGVTKLKSGKFKARLAQRHLGVFDTVEEAADTYVRAAAERFGEFARSTNPAQEYVRNLLSCVSCEA